jgi:Ubiquitin-like domain
MSDNAKMLGFYSVTSGMEIHVIDTDPFSLSRGGGLTDVSLVEKYRMPDEVYDKKAGTMRDFIRKKRAADPSFKLPNSVVKTPKDPNAEEELPPVRFFFRFFFKYIVFCTQLVTSNNYEFIQQ